MNVNCPAVTGLSSGSMRGIILDLFVHKYVSNHLTISTIRLDRAGETHTGELFDRASFNPL